MAIEAVIWDFGGVFTTSPFEAFRRFEAQRGLPRDFIRTVNAADPDANAWALFERSEIDAAAFDTMFLEEATRLGLPLHHKPFLDDPDEVLAAALRCARSSIHMTPTQATVQEAQ